MFKIICVTNRKLCVDDFIPRLAEIARCADAVILREKDLNEAEYAELARRAHKVCEDKLILHGASALPLLGAVPRIHLPLAVFENEPNLKRGAKLIGVSVHSPQEASRAEKLGADYVIAGHIYETCCKPGLPARGVDFLRETIRAVHIPVYPIGGVSARNIAEAQRAGASGACLMSALMTCEEPTREIAALKAALL